MWIRYATELATNMRKINDRLMHELAYYYQHVFGANAS